MLRPDSRIAPKSQNASRKSQNSAHADGDLVLRCLEGAPGAWDELYRQCHHRLVQSVRRLVGPHLDANVVDEICARVWYTLVRSDFALLSRFDSSRGCRLSTFLRGIARKEFAAFSRAERRRRIREQAVALPNPAVTLTDLACSRSELVEFLGRLTRSERAFCDDWLLSRDGERLDVTNVSAPKAVLSAANMRQLRYRIRRKLDLFLRSR